MNKDLSVDQEVWDLKGAFSCLEAAYLWCEIDPTKVENEDYHNFKPNLKEQIEKRAKIFEMAAQEKKLIYDDVITMRDARRVKCAPISKYTRASFRSYAESIGQRPLFLFHKERRSEQRTSIETTSKSKSELFDALSLHQQIVKVSRKLFLDSHYAQCIFEAFKAVNNAVKKKSGVKDKDGQALMGFVFSEEKPIIKVNSLKTQTDKDEQIGFKLLYMGAMTGIRNPNAHDYVTHADPLITLKHLAFASLLIERTVEGTRFRRKKN